MSYRAIENHLVEFLKTIKHGSGPNTGKPIFDNANSANVVAAEYERLSQGYDNLAIVEFCDVGDATPMGFGRNTSRFYQIEWRPKIWCLFKPNPKDLGIELQGNETVYDHLYTEYNAKTYQAILAQRLVEIVVRMQQSPTLSYETNGDGLSTNLRKKGNKYIKDYGVQSELGGSIQGSQILWAEPVMSNTEYQIFKGDFAAHVAISFGYRIVEGYISEPVT